MLRPLSEIKRVAPAVLLGGLLSTSGGQSVEAASQIIAQAQAYGVGLKDYLRLSIDPKLAEDPAAFLSAPDKFLNGYEAALSFLGLGVQDGVSWGLMISQSTNEVTAGFFNNFIAASLAMFVLVMAFNFFSDALQDALDPRKVSA